MSRYLPLIYQPSIFEIDYKNLKKLGIKCLVFDLDNTLGQLEHRKCPENTKKLIKSLKKDFIVVISSNNIKLRIKPYLEDLEVEGVCFSLKPSTISLKKIQKKYHLEKEEMALIGDQMVTDIWAGNRFGIKTILVDPLGKKDHIFTRIIRMIEKKVIQHYQKKGIFERGKYYG